MDIEKLMNDLKKLKRPIESFGRTDYLPVIATEYLPDVERVIRQHLLDNHDKEIGELKAKVYAYEQIIANSNFAPMIIKEKAVEERETLNREPSLRPTQKFSETCYYHEDD